MIARQKAIAVVFRLDLLKWGWKMENDCEEIEPSCCIFGHLLKWGWKMENDCEQLSHLATSLATWLKWGWKMENDCERSSFSLKLKWG